MSINQISTNIPFTNIPKLTRQTGTIKLDINDEDLNYPNYFKFLQESTPESTQCHTKEPTQCHTKEPTPEPKQKSTQEPSCCSCCSCLSCSCLSCG